MAGDLKTHFQTIIQEIHSNLELFFHFDIQGTRNSVLFRAVERGNFPAGPPTY